MEKNKNKSEPRSLQYSSSKETGLLNPEQRLKLLSDYGASVEIDFNLPPRRYFRSGVEMIRMATTYMEEENFENAYILYMKFMTIFLEKIRNHPQYDLVPIKERAVNQQTLRDVLPKAEALKKTLLEQYKVEMARHLADGKRKQKLEQERLKREEEQRLHEEETRRKREAHMAAIKAAAKIPSQPLVEGTLDDSKDKHFKQEIATPFVLPQKDEHPQSPSLMVGGIPSIDRSTKPHIFGSDKHTLRDVVLPNKIINEFLLLASTNTIKNKETCGVLAGKLERNKLLVTHLLIPQQTGTPDSCATHNEEDIFDYQDQHNLITLGWIHTHPTQTAFLSSVDLHTHCAYQLMMAEAIAVVCAPKYEETGYYTLTPEYGLSFIANCRQTGFHPHPTEPPLYVKAKHCKMDTSATIVVIDLRK